MCWLFQLNVPWRQHRRAVIFHFSGVVGLSALILAVNSMWRVAVAFQCQLRVGWVKNGSFPTSPAHLVTKGIQRQCSSQMHHYEVWLMIQGFLHLFLGVPCVFFSRGKWQHNSSEKIQDSGSLLSSWMHKMSRVKFWSVWRKESVFFTNSFSHMPWLSALTRWGTQRDA